jgi:hypothetical protein
MLTISGNSRTPWSKPGTRFLFGSVPVGTRTAEFRLSCAGQYWLPSPMPRSCWFYESGEGVSEILPRGPVVPAGVPASTRSREYPCLERGRHSATRRMRRSMGYWERCPVRPCRCAFAGSRAPRRARSTSRSGRGASGSGQRDRPLTRAIVGRYCGTHCDRTRLARHRHGGGEPRGGLGHG